MDSLLSHDVSCIFGNPGTTENSVLDRLVDYPQLAYYLTLHEGVAISAASFYALATGKTGVANLHVAPGLGNAIGMMFGALKANAPLIVTAGQQDTRMRLRRTLFSHDLVAMAAPVTKWSVEPRNADEVAPIMHRAFEVAHQPPRGPVFVALPVDVMEQETKVAAVSRDFAKKGGPAAVQYTDCLVDMLLSSQNLAFVIGDDVASLDAMALLVKLIEMTGASAFRECMHAQISFPTRHSNYRGHMPFDAASIRQVLLEFDCVVLIGGQFFEEMWFEDVSAIPKSTQVARLEETKERLESSFAVDTALVGDITSTLEVVVTGLTVQAAPTFKMAADERNRNLKTAHLRRQEAFQQRIQDLPHTPPISPMLAVYEISRALPDDVVVADESLTSSLMDIATTGDAIADGSIVTSLEMAFDFGQPGDFFAGRGGGLGQAMSGAVGLQLAYPERRVAALIGDGSAMYTIQALWTAAHYELPILFFVLSNREYRVLKHNLDIYRHRFGVGGNRPYLHTDLSEPKLSYSEIARGMGVEAAHVTQVDQLAAAIKRALAEKKPFLIEVEISGKP